MVAGSLTSNSSKLASKFTAASASVVSHPKLTKSSFVANIEKGAKYRSFFCPFIYVTKLYNNIYSLTIIYILLRSDSDEPSTIFLKYASLRFRRTNIVERKNNHYSDLEIDEENHQNFSLLFSACALSIVQLYAAYTVSAGHQPVSRLHSACALLYTAACDPPVLCLYSAPA